MKLNKVAIITGASRGIGKAAAIRFAAHHYHITMVALEHQELKALAEELEKDFKTESVLCAGDLRDKDFLYSVVHQTVEKWGRIDVLVNNAAWRNIETMRTIQMETWEQTLQVCLTAPAFLAKWSADVMEKNKIQGTIINVSSIMAERAGGYSPAYIAAKGALESLTYELAVTYGRRGIRVVCVQLGYIETNLSHDYTNAQGENISEEMINQLTTSIPLSRGGSPAEVAEAIFWLSSEQASYITGTTLQLDGGFSHNFNSYSLKKMQFPEEF